MGKGNRSRADRAEELITSTSPALQEKQKKTNKVTILVTVIVVLLIAVFALASLCVSKGWLERSKTAVSSDNYRVSGTMMSYYVQAYYANNLRSYASYYGIDDSKPLNTQYAYDGVTWYEYIASNMQEQIKQKLAFCEGAKKDGMKLDKENEDAIAEQIKMLKEAASQNLMSANQYCANVFGTGVSVGDVEKAMELDALAQQYTKKLYDENEEDLKKDGSEAELKKYVDEHPETFLSANTLQYSFKAELKAADAEATDLEKAAYEADKNTRREQAEALKSAAISEEAFKAWVAAELCGTNADEVYEAAYATAFKSVAAENMPDSAAIDDAKAKILDYCKKAVNGEEATAPDFGTGAGATQFKSICDSVYGTLVTSGINGLEATSAYADPTDSSATNLEKWLFAKDRAAGDVTVIENEADTSTTFTVVFVKKASALDETPVRDAAHILVSSSAQAEELLNKFKTGEKQDLDAFKALGEGVTEDSGIVYENITKGQMVSEFENWVFDEARKEGDTDIVVTDYGNHVMYFIGVGEETWKYNARESIVNDRLLDWCSKQIEACGIKANPKFFVELQ